MLFVVDKMPNGQEKHGWQPPHVGRRKAVCLSSWLNYSVIECVKLFGKTLRAQSPKHGSKETNCAQPARA